MEAQAAPVESTQASWAIFYEISSLAFFKKILSVCAYILQIEDYEFWAA